MKTYLPYKLDGQSIRIPIMSVPMMLATLKANPHTRFILACTQCRTACAPPEVRCGCCAPKGRHAVRADHKRLIDRETFIADALSGMAA